MERKKLKIRSNRKQIEFLWQYMKQNPNFVAGNFKTPNGAAAYHKQWADLKTALDQMGPHRSIEQWKLCWRDQKRKASVEQKEGLQKVMNTKEDRMSKLSEDSMLTVDSTDKTDVGITLKLPVEFTSPSTSSPPTTIERYRLLKRKAQSSDRFLNAQLEMNSLLINLIKEVKRGNDLMQDHLRVLANKFGENVDVQRE